MRIDVLFNDRVGIAQEILAALARRSFNVTAVEVLPPHVYVEAPALDEAGLVVLREELLGVPGVQLVGAVSMLPGAQRSLYLDALLASQPDPVFALDADGKIVLTNRAAQSLCGLNTEQTSGMPTELPGVAIEALIGLPAFMTKLTQQGYHLPATEVEVNGEPYLLETMPLHEDSGKVAGAVLTLHAPARLGERLSAMQNLNAGGFDNILGESAEMLQLKSRAARMALVDAPLLITGETGTGKELLAHACHGASPRSQQPFFALNCAALPENLAESELFGYSPGAFTGALRGGKPGLLELADGGTVLLDEVGEMSPYLQAKLLRFLNDGSFRRVGGDRELKVNVRIISATHRALDGMVAAGSFRQDLLYRLNVLNLHVPPLRERTDDILPLARALLTQACAQANHRPARLSPTACAALLTNPWAGNVRQLQNVIFRAVTMTDANVIDVADLELAGSLHQGGANAPVESLAQAVADFEKNLLTSMYREFPSTRRLALRLKTSHSAIAARIKRYKINS
ncbi:MAG: sigma 54-interacting transcriptional regulator [Betaproteobacteria bacterium]|jgi:transcriptional regulator of aroF, aroG, tyrA and aromatic amino acid transport|nr:sigma 54-interacting transcriptional regulator [Betaproteobacteria bacterium]MBP6644736.1 sigma 54-interacting transcriptional regulator [Burkholderiaceae bacterium]